MTKRNKKSALLMSGLAILLCISMLVGSTFAWFTDTVTSSGNKIVAGSLKVDLELLDKATGNWNSVKESKAPIFTYEKWEPGYTDVKILKIENEGNLALKWVAKFVCDTALTELANVIDVYVCPSETLLAYPADRNLTGYTKVGTVAEFVNTIEETTKGTLLPKDENGNGGVAYLGIALKMQESAGNIYQEKNLGADFDIQIFATQLDYENDTFGPEYDEDAVYYDVLVTTADELYAAVGAAKANTVIAVDGNITLTKALSKTGLDSITFIAWDDEATIDQDKYSMYFNGAKVSFNGLTLTHGEKAYGDGGQTSTAFAVFQAREVNYIDCTFNRSVGTVHASLHNFIGCTFNGVYNPDNAISEYPLYICDGENYNVVDCTFNCTNRGAILFYNDGGSGVDTLNISNTKFLGNIIADKTAVEIHNASNTQVYNVNIENVIVGNGIVNGLWRTKPANVGEVNVVVDGVTNVVTASTPAKLNSALAAAQPGDTIYLDTDVNVGTTQFALNKDVTLDLNGQELTTQNNYGGMTLSNGGSIKNGTINHPGNTAAIKVSGNAGAIENVTINITPTAGKTKTGIQVYNGKYVESIKNVTINGVTQGIEVAKGSRVDLIENVTVNAVADGAKKGVALLVNAASVGKAVNCSFAGDYGVYMMLNGEYHVALELVNCTAQGSTAAFIAHDEAGISNTTNCSLTFTYDADSTFDGDFVWNFEDECQGVVTLNAPN